jgi:3-phenylpropionate/trans-cinnamate dioxygenase ferredoxin reductase subunit
MPNSIIIIGAGQAAASCAARLRQKDSNCEITIIGDEPHLPYQRPPLSKKYATGDMTLDQLLLRPAEWYEQNQITCITHQRVKSVDTNAKTVNLENAETLNWDKLVFATGSRARSLPDAIGGNLSGVYLLRNLEDADNFADELVENRRVVIVGGGYIGLEAAAVCASRGLKVTMIEAAERILQRVACEETSNWFKTLHDSHGVTIHEGTGLQKFDKKDGKVSAAILADGTRIEADFALVGIGIIPNAELAQDAGLTAEAGIVTNQYCQTSNPDIYAAGDCAAFDYKNAPTRLESVQNAIDQAECAADNIAGETRAYEPYPWFWSDQYDVKLQIAGLNRGYVTIVTREGDREGSMAHFYFKGETFIAVDAMNDPRTYMVGKKMLEAGKNITPAQARDKSIELKSLLQS